MAKTVRCKACGYVTDESKVKDVCPACGLPKTVFEEYNEKISKKRKFILDLHLHPIAVHFPQALATLIPVLLIAAMLLDPDLLLYFVHSARVLAVLLPFTVVGAIVAGIVDGKTRMKKLNTPLLARKMILGFLLLLFSVPMAVVVIWFGNWWGWPFLLIALSLGCLICEVFLGRIGGKLMYARLKG